MSLYVTGTIIQKRLPKSVIITKSSKVYKEMYKGQFKQHVYQYRTVSGEEATHGWVFWKDRDIVYCLSNNTNTKNIDSC
jgi:hypothetical protein